MATSWAYSVDFTPPLKGHVFDLQPNGSSKRDIDFQTDMSKLLVFWEGFFDPHSAIKEYTVSIGTCPECGDVIAEQTVGMATGIYKNNHTLYIMDKGFSIIFI
jgi:hypothetical protein